MIAPPAIFDFRIDAWKQDTLPMARLADYLAGLAKLFEHREQVYFLQVRKGSAVPEIHVQQVAAASVKTRLKLVSTSNAPEHVKTIRAINDLLRDDNASATLSVKHGARLIDFPGCKTPLADEAIVHEVGELIGSVIRVGGKDETVPLLLQDTDGTTTYSCNTSRTLARELAQRLFGETVRVYGMGKWRRTAQRAWELESFKIKSWEQLDQLSLADSVSAIRAIDGSIWNELADPQAELRKLREA